MLFTTTICIIFVPTIMKSQVNQYVLTLVEMMRQANKLDAIINKTLLSYGITHVQYNVLRILRGAGDEVLTVGDIKERSFFENPDMTRLLDRLEIKKLITRTQNVQSRRKLDVSITDKGLRLLDKVWEAMLIATENFYEDRLSAEEVKLMYQLLLKLNKNP